MEKKNVKAPARNASPAGKATKPEKHIALQATVRKGKPGKAELRHVAWSSVELEELTPVLFRRFVVGQNIMVARMELKKGCMVPAHSHPNEQVSCVVEGAIQFGIGGKEIVVSAGEVLAIPPNLPHSAEALADAVAFDIFDPPRADWMNKTDSYLR
jgi:quercetin dioxygenase-like cupin family protein